VAEWKSVADLRFLAAVLRQDIKVRYAAEAFEIDGRSYAPGTLILTRTGNEALGDRFDEIVREAAAAQGQSLHTVATGLVSRGSDFGSDDVRFLKRPRIAVLAGEPLPSSSVGEVWHFFDQQIGYPVTLIDPEDLGGVRLGDYDVLVLPAGSYGSIFTDTRLDDLRAWIRSGGRLVALDRAAAFLAGKNGFQLERKPAGNGDEQDDELPRQRYADRQREAISDDVPGAIYRVVLDNTHPLGYGFGEAYYTLKQNDNAYEFLTGSDNWNVGILDPDSHVSGFVGYKAKARLNETLVFGVQQMGSGTVVYLADNPLFRAFWYNGKLLFGNAVFMVGQR
jgi:hypothetical protein